MRARFAPLLVLALFSIARADVVRLTNGHEIKGEIEKETDDEVVVRTPQGRVPIKKKQVASIIRGSAARARLEEAREILKTGDAQKAAPVYQEAFDAARDAGEDALADDIWKELDMARAKAGLPRSPEPPPGPRRPGAKPAPPKLAPFAAVGTAYYLRVASAKLGGKFDIIGTEEIAFDVKVTPKDGKQEKLTRLEKWNCALPERQLNEFNFEPKFWIEVPEKLMQPGLRVELDVWDLDVFSNDFITTTDVAFLLGASDFGPATKPERRLVKLRPIKAPTVKDLVLDGAEAVIELVRAERKAAPGIEGKKVLGELRADVAKANLPEGGDANRLHEYSSLVERIRARIVLELRASTDPAFRQAATEIDARCIPLLHAFLRADRAKDDERVQLASDAARGLAAIDDLMKAWSDK